MAKPSVTFMSAEDLPKDETLHAMRNELKSWVAIMSGDNIQLKKSLTSKTLFCINPATLDKREVGEETATELKAWWDASATIEEMKAILQTKMEVDGTPRNWSSGWMGSRWCDVIINRRLTRISFTSRKFNKMPQNHPTKNYIVSLDASDSRVLTDKEIKADKKKKVCAGCGSFTKTMKTDCCGERYCDEACWKEDYAEHRKRCEKSKKFYEGKKSDREAYEVEQKLYTPVEGESEEERRARFTEGVALHNARVEAVLADYL